MTSLSDEAVREQLSVEGPIGDWRLMPGTHTQLLDDSIRFDADGSGEMRLSSTLHGEERMRFRWRAEGRGVLAYQMIDDDPGFPNAGEREDDEWSHISFSFERRNSDTGSYWVMLEPGQKGFWDLSLPVVPA
jgi:hypothetical protein